MMFRIHEMPAWLALGCLFLFGCAEEPVLTPCTSSADCPATRTCIAGRCRVSPSDAAAQDAGDPTDASTAFDADRGDAAVDGEADGGCGTECCRTDDTAACTGRGVCRPDADGSVNGTCVRCDVANGAACALLASGERETYASDCAAYTAGERMVTRGTCQCDASNVCGGGQICNYGVRHARDCEATAAAPVGICVVPGAAMCDGTPRRELSCAGVAFSDDCERTSMTGMGVMARYAPTCPTVPAGAGECYDDSDCTPTQNCYAQRDGCMPGTCQRDPIGVECYDATDCAPWQDCTRTCVSATDCSLGNCVDAR